MSDTLISALLPVAQVANVIKDSVSPPSSSFDNSTRSAYQGLPVIENKPGNNITSILCIGFAIYFAMKCKKNGSVDPLQIVFAICCAPFYIAYRVVRPCD